MRGQWAFAACSSLVYCLSTRDEVQIAANAFEGTKGTPTDLCADLNTQQQKIARLNKRIANMNQKIANLKLAVVRGAAGA